MAAGLWLIGVSPGQAGQIDARLPRPLYEARLKKGLQDSRPDGF
ncbi:MAG: hypothetical protein ACI9EF_000081 [Pseudohongiellaceae bacterium]|jgi:hypothetical protein